MLLWRWQSISGCARPRDPRARMLRSADAQIQLFGNSEQLRLIPACAVDDGPLDMPGRIIDPVKSPLWEIAPDGVTARQPCAQIRHPQFEPDITRK